MKTKINKWDFIQLKSFCIEKEKIHKMKKLSTKWKKIIPNHTYDKECVYNIESTHNYNKMANAPIKKQAKSLYRPFFKEDIQMANTHKKC